MALFSGVLLVSGDSRVSDCSGRRRGFWEGFIFYLELRGLARVVNLIDLDTESALRLAEYNPIEQCAALVVEQVISGLLKPPKIAY
jgi:hypothetical protein